MPLTSKGATIKNAMVQEYGPKEGESAFYASKNKGTITGVDAETGSTSESPAENMGESEQAPAQDVHPAFLGDRSLYGMKGMDSVKQYSVPPSGSRFATTPVYGKK